MVSRSIHNGLMSFSGQRVPFEGSKKHRFQATAGRSSTLHDGFLTSSTQDFSSPARAKFNQMNHGTTRDWKCLHIGIALRCRTRIASMIQSKCIFSAASMFSRCIHSPSKYPNSPESWLIHEIAVFCASPLRFKILFLINEKPRLHFMHESRGKSRFSGVLSVFTFSVADCSTFLRDRSPAIYFQPRLSFFFFASLD